MFVAISAAYGAMTSALVERRFAHQGALATTRWTALLPLLLLAFLGPIGFAIMAGAAIVWLLVRRWPTLVAIWRSPALTWIGRAALVGFAAVRLVELVGDVDAIL